jgi:molybdopterin/thiamine biosynthesis adenylyltransferase
VGQPKSLVARESALALCPEAIIVAYHDNVKKPEFGEAFVKVLFPDKVGVLV